MQHGHATAAIFSVIVIALLALFVLGHWNPATGAATDTGGAAIATPTSTGALPTAPTTPGASGPSVGGLVVNSGFIPALSTLTITTDGIAYGSGTVQTLTIDAPGSGASGVTFRVVPVSDPLATPPAGSGDVLATLRGPTGDAYAALSAGDLARLRAGHGAGWYAFSATDADGVRASVALFLA